MFLPNERGDMHLLKGQSTVLPKQNMIHKWFILLLWCVSYYLVHSKLFWSFAIKKPLQLIQTWDVKIKTEKANSSKEVWFSLAQQDESWEAMSPVSESALQEWEGKSS